MQTTSGLRIEFCQAKLAGGHDEQENKEYCDDWSKTTIFSNGTFKSHPAKTPTPSGVLFCFSPLRNLKLNTPYIIKEAFAILTAGFSFALVKK